MKYRIKIHTFKADEAFEMPTGSIFVEMRAGKFNGEDIFTITWLEPVED